MSAIANALVVGGGIGGLTAAIALQRQGVAVDLVEVRPDLSVYGVGIIQPNNTLRALDKIGLARTCVEAGAPFPGWHILDAAGNLLIEALGENTAAPDYPAVNGITRPKFHQILTDAARSAGVSIRLGETFKTLEDDSSAVSVTFTTGQRGCYDLVVGSDGIYSELRRIVFGDSRQPPFTGQGVWRYNMPRPADLLWGHTYFGPDSKVGLVPMSDSLMYMLVVTAEEANSRFDGEAMAEAMRARLSAYSGLVAELSSLITDPTAVVYRPMESMLMASPWVKGRVVLIGDAAHSTTPHLAQGAAMAIEDAVLLGELMGRDAPVPALLEEFMARRFARVKFVVDSSAQLGAWELEEWSGVKDHTADFGALIHSAGLALLDDY